MLPREALRVERTDRRVFSSSGAAAAHARTMTVGGDYTYAPMRHESDRAGHNKAGQGRKRQDMKD
jgi:hypothetical protein